MLNATTPAAGIRPAAPQGLQKPWAEALPAEKPADPPAPSKMIRIDATLPLVVAEFRAADGRLQTSIPTPREIDAYRKRPDSAPDAALDLAG